MLQKIPVSEIPACFMDPISYPVTALPLLLFHRPESVTDFGVTLCVPAPSPWTVLRLCACGGHEEEETWLTCNAFCWLKSSKQSLLRLTHNANMLSEFTFNRPHWFAWNIDQIITASFPMDSPVSPWVWGEFQLSNQGAITDLQWLWSLRLLFYVSFADVSSPSCPCSQWCGFKADNGNKVAGCEKTSTCLNSTAFRSSPRVLNQNSLQGLWNQGAPTVQK